MSLPAGTGGGADVGAGAALFAFGVAILAATPTIEVTHATDPLGPRFLPRLLAVILMVLSALLVFLGALQARRARRYGERPPAVATPGDGTDADAPATPVTDGGGRRVLLLVAVMGAYVVLLPGIGYLIGSFLFFSASLAIAGQRRRWALLAQAAGTTLVLYFLFGVVLNIELPGGDFLPIRLMP